MSNYWLEEEVDLSKVSAAKLFDAIFKKVALFCVKYTSIYIIQAKTNQLLKVMQQHHAFADYTCSFFWKNKKRYIHVGIQKNDYWHYKEDAMF